MSVTFDDGSVEDFELVICAEGTSSATRAKILAQETRFRYLGAYMSFFKIPRRPEDDNWAYSVNGVGGTFITLRPGNETETTVLMTFLRKDLDIEGTMSRRDGDCCSRRSKAEARSPIASPCSSIRSRTFILGR